jgi:predicted cupin superfamily sugar epimerase
MQRDVHKYRASERLSLRGKSTAPRFLFESLTYKAFHRSASNLFHQGVFLTNSGHPITVDILPCTGKQQKMVIRLVISGLM